MKIIQIFNLLESTSCSTQDLEEVFYEFISYSDYSLSKIKIKYYTDLIIFLKFVVNNNIGGILEFLKSN